MDDLISGGPTTPTARQVEETSSDIFAQGGFTLHKRHSNTRELDTVNTQTSDESSDTQETCVKQQLGVPQRGQGALLGVSWDMVADTIQDKFPHKRAQPTKSGQDLRFTGSGFTYNALWKIVISQDL